MPSSFSLPTLGLDIIVLNPCNYLGIVRQDWTDWCTPWLKLSPFANSVKQLGILACWWAAMDFFEPHWRQQIIIVEIFWIWNSCAWMPLSLITLTTTVIVIKWPVAAVTILRNASQCSIPVLNPSNVPHPTFPQLTKEPLPRPYTTTRSTIGRRLKISALPVNIFNIITQGQNYEVDQQVDQYVGYKIG